MLLNLQLRSCKFRHSRQQHNTVWWFTGSRWRAESIPWDWFCHLTSALLSFSRCFSKIRVLRMSPAVGPLPNNWGFKVSLPVVFREYWKLSGSHYWRIKSVSQVTKPTVVQWWYHYSGLKGVVSWFRRLLLVFDGRPWALCAWGRLCAENVKATSTLWNTGPGLLEAAKGFPLKPILFYLSSKAKNLLSTSAFTWITAVILPWFPA